MSVLGVYMEGERTGNFEVSLQYLFIHVSTNMRHSCDLLNSRQLE